ncbi:MAG: hypothetical protein GKC53_04800 [Neisseriaceae bacterium]|nr:MAG: hypothetical protein GKC53_04800 [Neisseriaceae bacterium]
MIGSRNPLRHKYINELIYNILLDGDENFQYMENSILPYLNVINNNLTMEYDEIERSFILLGEICVRNHDIDKAKEILDNGLEVLPNNESLKENLKIVLAQILAI